MRTVSWSTDLNEYAQSVLGQPFVWGETDCAYLVVGAVRAMYGADVLKLGTWTTRTGALRALRRGGSPRDAFERAGAVEVSYPFRQRGDLVQLPGEEAEGFPGLGIVVRAGVLTVDQDEIVLIAPPDPEMTVWRLPNG